MKPSLEILTMPRTAYSLIRWSDGAQREGHSQERQETFAERWCREHDVRLDDSRSMILDGQSAFRGHHRQPGARKVRALADFLDAIRRGEVVQGSILIMENLDRLSREEIDEAWENFRGILKAGVDVVTQSPERHYTKESLRDLCSIFEVKFIMYRAHEESLLKSKRCRAAWVKKKQEAATSRRPVSKKCPAWLELGAGRYRLLVERVRIVKRMIAWSLQEGYGSIRIATLLSREKVPCFGWNGVWTPTYVRVILKSRALYGAYEPGYREFETGRKKKTGELVEGYYPPLISREQWEALQDARAARKRKCGRPDHDETNLFTSFIHDARTRERMHIRECVRRGKKYVYLSVYRGHDRTNVNYFPLRNGIVRALGELRPEDILPTGQEADDRLCRIGEPSIEKGIVETRRRHRETEKALRILEQEAQTNRTKSLGVCQSALSLLDTPEHRRTARSRIRQLVEAIYLHVQPVGKRKIVHVQIYFRGGRRKYLVVLPADLPPGIRPRNLGACDFRAGDIGDEFSRRWPDANTNGLNQRSWRMSVR
jgi:hypothetical protein